MLHHKLIQPSSIAVIGASDKLYTPGGKALFNIKESPFSGKLYAVNPKAGEIQGITCYRDVRELPPVDTAILAIPARLCPETVRILAEEKDTRGFIIYSAGFSELDEQGARWEREIARIVDACEGTLLGPNNIGLMNPHYAGVFTSPVPTLYEGGIDFISGSGATAVFIMEMALTRGLRFHSVFSVGNSAQTGVEEVLAHLDETFDPEHSSRVVMMYMETIRKPGKLLRHARSLYEKGVRIAAIKSGRSEAGSRAASSHTGALANPDTAVDALFRQAGIIRCYGRDELVNVAAVLSYPLPRGKRAGIITHAGGPAVMLTDALSEAGMEIPPIDKPEKTELSGLLFPGSSVDNPIDFLATGTAEQLDHILAYARKYFDELDVLPVIFGSPGLFSVSGVYEVLARHIRESEKPVYPVLPSVINAAKDIETFTAAGHAVFFDEVSFGKALGKVVNAPYFPSGKNEINEGTKTTLQSLVPQGYEGYLPPGTVRRILSVAGIPVSREIIVRNENELSSIVSSLTFPVVLKITGPIHKTEANGVRTGVSKKRIFEVFRELIRIPQAVSVVVQPQYEGIELLAGIKKEPGFGHHLVFGAGGTGVEVIRDFQTCSLPPGEGEIRYLNRKLKIFPILEGHRGKAGIDLEQWYRILTKISLLPAYLPQIREMDINPFIAGSDSIVAVDARIKVEPAGKSSNK